MKKKETLDKENLNKKDTSKDNSNKKEESKENLLNNETVTGPDVLGLDESENDVLEETLEKEVDSNIVTALDGITADDKNDISKYVDKKGRPLSAKKIARLKAKEARDEARKKQADIEKKINDANKKEARIREASDRSERAKERAALKSQRNAVKLARKRQSNMQYVERFEANIEDGLSDEQVNQRILEGFSNFKPKSSSKSYFQIFVQNIFTFFNILTMIIAGFLISVGAIKDCIFLIIITSNIVIGIIQEINAKKTIDKLSLISAPTVNVLRNGKISEISIGEVVLDDIMILETGKQICTDSIVVDGTLEVNESMLTGESDAIIKKPGDNLYSGSYVVSGNCKARVEKVGKDNYIESLTTSAKKYVKPRSELLRSLNIIIYVMAFIIIPIGLGLFYIQYFRNQMIYAEAIRKTAGAMIGMIPSGLYLCTSAALAIGVMRLGKKNVLVQELYCIEMLARIDVLCLDKTGTITDGSMAVKDIIEYKNFAGLNTKYAISAMLNALNDHNLTSQALEKYFGNAKMLKCVGTIPFSSKRKFSAASFDKCGTFIMGAPEFILKDSLSLISKDINKHVKNGYRVILLAYCEGTIDNQTLPDSKIEPMSLILIEDNIRPDAIETIKYFRESGVEVKVISGDNPITVGKIAQRAGIENAENYISLDGLSEQDVVRAATKYTVFGRVSPSQKRLLVKTLKENGKTVAMTGDGVNDILALKEADCSIAMASGSEAARNVSHLVLVDSNFGSMPSVVAEGRRVINNITKVARLYLTKTMFSLMLAIIALIKGYYPISTNQLFMIDMFCIGIPSMVLIIEKNNQLNKGHFLSNVIKSAVPGAIVIVIQSLIVFLLESQFAMNQTQTSTIIVIAATFTSEMVLFNVCSKPEFTYVHKILFYSMFALFIIVTLLTPRFFDFSPLASVGTYYSDNVYSYNWDTPRIGVTLDNTYAVNGYVLEKTELDGSNYNKFYIAAINTSTHTVSINDNGELVIDTYTPVKVEDFNYLDNLPKVYKTMPINDVSYYGLGGYETELKYEEAASLSVNESGDLTYGASSTGYNIKPRVLVKSGYYVVINNHNNSEYTSVTKAPVSANSSLKSNETYEVNADSISIDSKFHVYVNGVMLEKSGTGENLPFVLYPKGMIYGVNNENKLVVDMERSSIAFDEEKQFNVGLTVKGQNYQIDDVDTGVAYAPAITVTEANYFIIEGKLTEYKNKGNGGKIVQTLSDDGYLELNGIKTSYRPDVYKSQGGNIEPLPINCLILLFMLCLLTMPLMKVINGFVPFVKRWVLIILDKINKL